MSEQGNPNVGEEYIVVAAPESTQIIIQSLNKIKDTYEKVCGRSDTTDFTNILKVLPSLLELQLQKSSVYGRSYCRHGDLSIFFNIERKWDRILNIMEKTIASGNVNQLYQDESGTPTETFFDTVVDLVSYSLLWIGYVVENHPEVFEQFIKMNKLSK